MKKVVYYNVDEDVNIEQSLLDELGITDIQLELIDNGDQCDNPEAFLEAVKDADGVVTEYFQVTRDVIEKMDKVKIISVQAIGYNVIDADAATDHGIVVTNAPGFCTEEVAVHTVGLMIDCIKNITFLDRSVRKGEWNCLLPGLNHRLSGQKVGFVSYGSIPQKMTPVLKALGLKIAAYEPYQSAEKLAEFGVEKIETVEELLSIADFVSLHCPLIYPDESNEGTYHLINEARLKLMKETSYLINTSRGAVVDEHALADALKNNIIKGAAVDVIEDENGDSSPLFGLNNCIITPHSAFASEEAFEDARRIAMKQQIELLSENKLPQFTVNKQVADKLKK